MIGHNLHPLIRIVVLIVFIGAMALARPVLPLAGAVLLGLAFTLSGSHSVRGLYTMIMRLRWLLLAIMIVYGWWTPGQLVFPSLPAFSPTLEGLGYGLVRAGALICIAGAVFFMMQVTERSQLLSALLQVTGPFFHVHGKERFAVRTLLTLEAVAQVQPIIGKVLKDKPGSAQGFSGLVYCLKSVYGTALEHAGKAPAKSIDILEPTVPPLIQWLYPLLLALVFWLAVNF